MDPTSQHGMGKIYLFIFLKNQIVSRYLKPFLFANGMILFAHTPKELKLKEEKTMKAKKSKVEGQKVDMFLYNRNE